MGVIIIFKNNFIIRKIYSNILLLLLFLFIFTIQGYAGVDYVKVISSEAYILNDPNDPVSLIGIVKEGDIQIGRAHV